MRHTVVKCKIRKQHVGGFTSKATIAASIVDEAPHTVESKVKSQIEVPAGAASSVLAVLVTDAEQVHSCTAVSSLLSVRNNYFVLKVW